MFIRIALHFWRGSLDVKTWQYCTGVTSYRLFGQLMILGKRELGSWQGRNWKIESFLFLASFVSLKKVIQMFSVFLKSNAWSCVCLVVFLFYLFVALFRTCLTTWSIKFPSDPSLRSGYGVKRGAMTNQRAELKLLTWYSNPFSKLLYL